MEHLSLILRGRRSTWSTSVSFLRGKCSTRSTSVSFCVAGAARRRLSTVMASFKCSCSIIIPFCTSTHHHLHNTIYTPPSTLHRRHNTIYTTSSNATSSTHTIYTTSSNTTSATQPHLHNTICTTSSTQHPPSTLQVQHLEHCHLTPSASFLLIPLLLFFLAACSLFCFVDLFHMWMSEDIA